MTGVARTDAKPGAAERRRRLLARSAAQRESVAANWERLAPTLASCDTMLVRLGSARTRVTGWMRHPLAAPVAALSLSALVASGGATRLLGALGKTARVASRLTGGAAAAGSLWSFARAAIGLGHRPS